MKILVAILSAVILATVGLIVYAIVTDDSAQRCEAAGGHIHTQSATGVGVNPSNGQPVVTTTYADLCLTDDGRIITEY